MTVTPESSEPSATGACRVLAIVGPTASGKTATAEELAVRLGGEIVSADSMQIYRGMDVGTSKTPAERRRVRQWCVDLVEPGRPYSAALYQRAAREAIAHIHERDALPVVVGGTGLYVRAALDDWVFPTGEAETPERASLERLADELGADALHARLAAIDPEGASLIHPNNVRRVIRALEMAATGVSYAAQAARFASRNSVYDSTFVGLHIDRARLYERIGERVDAMLDSGLLGEVEGLLAAGYRDALTASQAIGYKQLVPVLEAGAPLAEAVEQIRKATRRYAKRQYTWFRADPRVNWVDATELSPAKAADTVLELLESLGRTVRTPHDR